MQITQSFKTKPLLCPNRIYDSCFIEYNCEEEKNSIKLLYTEITLNIFVINFKYEFVYLIRGNSLAYVINEM